MSIAINKEKEDREKGTKEVIEYHKCTGLDKSATIKDLKVKLASEKKKNKHSIAFYYYENGNTKDKKYYDDEKTLSGITSVFFKDLGTQIGYRTVFILEYLGPLVFVMLYYVIRTSVPEAANVIWGTSTPASTPLHETAFFGVACWCIHFLKREFETLFVHKFSRPTMPLSNLWRNCFYYWSFGAVIGYPLCQPGQSFPAADSIQVKVGLGIFAVSEICNFICHVMLSNLRAKEGEKTRPKPTGFLFDVIACPNYTFEILGWVGFSIMVFDYKKPTYLAFSWLFTFVGFYQMTEWALGKHRGYQKEYGAQYKAKIALMPLFENLLIPLFKQKKE